MSCAQERTELLEALVRGELSPEREHWLHHHLERCQPCAVELSWLRSEQTLFAQRAERQLAPGEVWAGVGQALSARAPRRRDGHRFRRVGLAVAAGALLFVFGQVQPTGARRDAVSAASLSAQPEGGEHLISLDPTSAVEERHGACLLATPAGRLRCEPLASVPASFP